VVRRVCHVISLASTRKLRKLFLIGQESFAHAIGPSCYITFYPFALSHWGQMDNAIVICLHIFHYLTILPLIVLEGSGFTTRSFCSELQLCQYLAKSYWIAYRPVIRNELAVEHAKFGTCWDRIFVASQQTFPFIEVMQISILTGIYEDSSEALLMIPQVHGYHI